MASSSPFSSDMPCGSRGLAGWTLAALAATLVGLATLGWSAIARGQETPLDSVDTVTEAENVPREAEQAPENTQPLPARAEAQPARNEAAGRATQNQPLPPPTTDQGTTAAAMTAPPSRIDFRRFGAKFADAARDANPTPAEQAASGALVIAKVRSPSAASSLGLKPEDQIVSVAGQQITSSSQIGQAIEKALSTGRRDDHVAIPLVVRRAGADQTLTISNAELTMAGYGPMLAEYGHYVPPQHVTGYRGANDGPDIPANPAGAYLGVELNSQYRNAAIVSRVLPGTPAAQAGLEEGDRIFAVNNRPIESPNELIYWVSQMQPGDTIEISYDRAHDVDVTLGTRSGDASGARPDASPAPSSAAAPAPAPSQ